MQTYVAYYRVSTKKQGQSGLGLDAQRSSVLGYVQNQALIISEFMDVESGKQDRRPELLKAIEYAKQHRARLVIAKLDRLSRNMTFVSSLLDSKVSFVCADMPDANEFTIHIFAALAQQERKMISERTKKALDEKLLRIGQWRRSGRVFQDPIISAKAAESNRNRAATNENNRKAIALIKALTGAKMSYVAIAQQLNLAGFKTAQGSTFQATQVIRLANRDKANRLSVETS